MIKKSSRNLLFHDFSKSDFPFSELLRLSLASGNYEWVTKIDFPSSVSFSTLICLIRKFLLWCAIKLTKLPTVTVTLTRTIIRLDVLFLKLRPKFIAYVYAAKTVLCKSLTQCWYLLLAFVTAASTTRINLVRAQAHSLRSYCTQLLPQRIY